jgi:hypothetical protein
MCRLTWNLYQLCARLGIALIPRHIPGKRNIIADALSRADRLVQTEWTLFRDVVLTLVGMRDAPTVDLFATRLNKRLPLYYSPLPDDEALGVDSLSASWEGLNAYAYPHSFHPCGLEQASQLPRQVVPDRALLAQPGLVSNTCETKFCMF